MYYDTIPTIAIDTVRSLFRESYVEMQFATASKLFSFIDTSDLVASMKLVLSQAAFVISLVLAAFIVFIGVQRRMLKAQTEQPVAPQTSQEEVPSIPTGALRDRWNVILGLLDSSKESDWKLAVIEADKLVDDSLAKAGYAGATFGDRLSNIEPGMLLSLDGIWWAHKVRNRLAHEVDYFLRYTEARQAVGYFEAALAELQLI